jgi:hypothetical protein
MDGKQLGAEKHTDEVPAPVPIAVPRPRLGGGSDAPSHPGQDDALPDESPSRARTATRPACQDDAADDSPR